MIKLTASSVSSKRWFSDLRSDAHRVVDSRAFSRRSRVAILDTGIDLLHPRFEVAVNEGRVVSKSFVTGLPEDQDRDGHGTHSAHLSLLVDPRAKLFVARIVEFGTQQEFEANTLAIANVRGPSVYFTMHGANSELAGHSVGS